MDYYRVKPAFAFKAIQGKKVRIVERRESDVVRVSIVDDVRSGGRDGPYTFLMHELEPWAKEADTIELLKSSTFLLLSGNPMDPSSTDELAQKVNLPMGVTPSGEGWRILTGNSTTNLWARIAYRYEIEEA